MQCIIDTSPVVQAQSKGCKLNKMPFNDDELFSGVKPLKVQTLLSVYGDNTRTQDVIIIIVSPFRHDASPSKKR